MLPERTADVRSAVDEWVEQETRHGIRYEKDDVECAASGDSAHRFSSTIIDPSDRV